MSIAQKQVERLEPGDYLGRDEFLRRWDAMPELRRAELIGGVVYMPSPLSRQHGTMHNRIAQWLGYYATHTPGCEAGDDATWLMQDDAPQPDVYLRILPDYGGRSRSGDRFAQGAPELIAEICLSSASYDLHQKKDLYQASGVPEYVTVLLAEKEVRWHHLVDGAYRMLTTSPEGVLQSVGFPGLWLNVPALLDGEMLEVLNTLNVGLRTSEHAAFAARLAAKRSG